MIFRELPPPGYTRILDEGVPVCDAPDEQLNLLLQTEGIVWDDDHYVLTAAGRAYIKSRLLN